MKHLWCAGPRSPRNADPYDGSKECDNCHKFYHTHVTVQTSFIGIDYDMCPYCGACNAVSREVLFVNSKIREEGH